MLDGPLDVRRRRWFAFFDLLCFGTFVDSSSERPKKVISRPEIMRAIGLPPATHTRDFVAKRFLDEIVGGKVLGNFRYGEHEVRTFGGNDPVKRLARYAIPNFGPFKAALEEEVATFHEVDDKDKVHLVSGEPWRPTTPKRLRTYDRADAEAVRSNVPEAQRIIDHLNALPSHLFTKKVKANIGAAVGIAITLDEQHRMDQLTKLHRIASQPQPFYGPSKEQNTVRIFATNVAIQGLKNVVKYALIDGWTTFDLRSSQLAIVAADWNIPELRDWLSDFNNSIWNELCSLFPSTPKTDSKPVLKDAVYSVCYGGGTKRIRNTLVRGLGLGEAQVQTFLDHRLIAPVLVERRKKMRKIINGGGAVDCFGRRIACKGRQDVRSVMAQLSQAQEMKLLLPAIELAKKRADEFTIVLWEHDGFSVHFTRKDRIESESQRIIDAVNAECSNRGYPTRLERKGP